MPCNHSSITKGCKDCEKLVREWNKKLEKSEFVDIEQPDGNLKQWDSFNFAAASRNKQGGGVEFKEEYYRQAGHFLHEYQFEDQIDKAVWELHAAGQTLGEITESLHNKLKKPIVQQIVKKLVAKMRKHLWE